MLNSRLIPFIYAFLLSLFVSSLIIFDLSENIIYSNLFNITLWGFFFMVFLIKKSSKIPYNKMIFAYIIFTIFAASSVLWALDFDLAFSYAMRLMIVSLNLIVLYVIFKDYKLENTILYGILIGAFYNYLIAFSIISVNYEIYEFGRFTGSVGNANKLSKIMLISIFASLVLLLSPGIKNYFKIYNYINIILALYIIFLTVSKKAIILAPLLLLASFSIKKVNIKNILLFVLILFVSYEIFIRYADFTYIGEMYELFIKRFSGLIEVLIGVGGDASSSEREHLITAALNVFSGNPLFGIGLNNFRLLHGIYAHNNYLELLSGVGIIGMMLFYSIYVYLIFMIAKMHSSSLQRYFMVMTFVLLAMDFATVSYFNKLILFLVLYMYYKAEMNSKANKR